MSLKRTDITVLGGGVIGLSIALRLLNAGREVVLIDPEEPGTGTSFGNAGTIAEYAVLPVGSPDIIRQLPSLLFNKNSPIAIKRSAILSLCPWLKDFYISRCPRMLQEMLKRLPHYSRVQEFDGKSYPLKSEVNLS